MKTTKRFLSALLVVMMVFSVFGVSSFAASDKVYNKLIELNTATKVSLDEGETYIYGFKPEVSGNYALLSQSDVDVVLKTESNTYLSGGNFTPDSTNFYTGNIFMIAGKTYTFTVSAKNGKACDFELYLMFSPTMKLIKGPDKINYADGYEVIASGDTLVFNRDIDFTGAELAVFPLGSDEGITVRDNDVLLFVTETEFDSSENVWTVTIGEGILFSDTVKLNIIEYPIRRINIKKDADLLLYHFGKDGEMSGSAFKPTYSPDIKLEGMELEVQYKEKEAEVVTVLKDEATGRYYIETELGKLYADISCDCSEAGTCEVTVSIAKEEITFDIEVEKATFLERVVIFFKMLFGAL